MLKSDLAGVISPSHEQLLSTKGIDFLPLKPRVIAGLASKPLGKMEVGMNMQPVFSSDLHSVGYAEGVLHIRFNSGGTYQYSGVPERVFRGLMAAQSHGRFFHANIKGRYPYNKIG